MSCYCLMNNIRINSSNTGPAWARLEEYLLNPPRADRDLDEGLFERLKEATSLGTALNAMGWEFNISTEGHLFRFIQTRDDAFDGLHQVLWVLLAPVLEGPATPFFVFSADDGNIRRWRFEGDMLHEDHVERYIWSCDDVVIFPRKEVLSVIDKMADGLVNLRNKVDVP